MTDKEKVEILVTALKTVKEDLRMFLDGEFDGCSEGWQDSWDVLDTALGKSGEDG